MPAVAFGRWLADNHSDIGINYVCGARELELEIYENAGITPRRLSLTGSPLSGGISTRERTVRTLNVAQAFAEARKILKEARPSCCVLFGGYVSLPFLMVCKAMRIPIIIHEQNACAGMVTRLAAKIGATVLTGWESCFPLQRSCFTRVGVPVRRFKKIERVQALKLLGIDEDISDKTVAVVFSGSLGSVSIKEKIYAVAGQPVFKKWLFLLPAVSTPVLAEKILDSVWELPKIWEPYALFSAADCIVTRAGGSTLTETAVRGLPALVIPWRGAAGDHQYHNAVAFAAENTGLILESENDLGLFSEKLLTLKELADVHIQNEAPKLYNKVDKICGEFWEAIVSRM